jgi:hypothetical protein
LLAFRAAASRTIEHVPQEPVHRDFVIAIRILDAVGMPYAELWRLMGPVSSRLGRPRPSYASVRRIAVDERRRAVVRSDVAVELFGDMVTGRLPYRFR